MACRRFLPVFMVLLWVSAGQTRADMPPYGTHTSGLANAAEAISVTIHIDRDLAQSRIEIPTKFLTQPAEFQGSSSESSEQAHLRERTVIAGTILSLLLIGGGLVTFMFRRRPRRMTIVSSLTLLTILGIYVSISSADMGPRPVSPPSPNPAPVYRRAPSRASTIQGNLVIRPAEHDNGVVLHIGRDLADKLSKASEVRSILLPAIHAE